MKAHRAILMIGIIEILIGFITLLGTTISLLFSFSTKQPNILSFVVITACISLSLGIGIIHTKKWAYHLLLYFASVIFLSKILFFLEIIHLNGALLSSIPQWLNHIISMGYHGAIFLYLRKSEIKEIFQI